CLYSISPYRLFVQEHLKGWQKIDLPAANLHWDIEGHVSVSTNPIMVDGSLLVWFHTRHDKTDTYHQGAALINPKTFKIEYYTRTPLVSGGKCEGRRPGLLYISSCVYLKERKLLRVYYGEADAHSSYMDFNKRDLITAIRKFPVEVKEVEQTEIKI
ncbi:MAG: hypothetical protein AAB649_04215, partial [Patescibacteria group bacterium]